MGGHCGTLRRPIFEQHRQASARPLRYSRARRKRARQSDYVFTLVLFLLRLMVVGIQRRAELLARILDWRRRRWIRHRRCQIEQRCESHSAVDG